jgi:hypothetical protein
MDLREEIETVRNELNNLIEKDMDNKRIYELSVKLDKLIVEYHRNIVRT